MGKVAPHDEIFRPDGRPGESADLDATLVAAPPAHDREKRRGVCGIDRRQLSVKHAAIDISEEAGVRFLHFGSTLIQGAMRIARPYALELDYTRDMMLSLLLHSAPWWPRHVLLIGLGAASLTKFLYRNRPRAILHVVEIEPAVVAAARHFFRLPDDPGRLTIEIGDGADYVARTRRRFDLILVDGFDGKGRAGMLDMLPFYANGRCRLSEQGLLVTNLLWRSRGVAPSLDRVRGAFDGRVCALPRSDGGNTVALAAAGKSIEIPLGELRAAARLLKQDAGLNLLPTLARLVTAPGGAGDRLSL